MSVYEKDVFKKAVSSFLDCENASLLGKIRATVVLKLIFKSKVKLSLKLIKPNDISFRTKLSYIKQHILYILSKK